MVDFEYVESQSGGVDVMATVSWVVFGMYVVLFVVTLTITLVQDYASFYNSQHLRTVVTQTAGLWTPVGAVLRPASSISGDFSLSGKCAAFLNGAGFAQSSTAYVQPVTFGHGIMDGRYLLIGISISAMVFQFVAALSTNLLFNSLRSGNNHFGTYIERSISFPLAVAILYGQTGGIDLWTLTCLTFNAWACALLALFAETLFQCDGGCLELWEKGVIHFHSIAMFGAWCQFAIVFIVLQSNPTLVATCFTAPLAMASLAQGAVYVSLCLFAIVLMVQTISLIFKYKPASAGQDRDKIKYRVQFAIRVEYVYMIIDVAFKAILCSTMLVETRV